jgi:hypothetical protein
MTSVEGGASGPGLPARTLASAGSVVRHCQIHQAGAEAAPPENFRKENNRHE